ncbi:hypothetical protein [Rhizobium mesosinicum]|nr:hypothetical protein [Rhizobium mesosinicum]
MTTASPPARYGAVEGALASGFVTATYTTRRGMIAARLKGKRDFPRTFCN